MLQPFSRATLLVAIVALTACASIDRPYVTYSDSPGDKTKDRVYAWTPGAAAAIGVDQFNGASPDGKGSKDGVKFCVLTAATARTSSTGFATSMAGSSASGTNVGLNFEQTVGALLLKNESAAATFLDIGLFHLCMLNANSGGIDRSDIVKLAGQLFKSAEEVSKSSLQYAPLIHAQPPSASASAVAPTKPASAP